MYQIRTFNDLCYSKKYVKDMDGVRSHLGKVILATKKFRLENKSICASRDWSPSIYKEELYSSAVVLKINEEIMTEWEKLLGCEIAISDPITNATP